MYVYVINANILYCVFNCSTGALEARTTGLSRAHTGTVRILTIRESRFLLECTLCTCASTESREYILVALEYMYP